MNTPDSPTTAREATTDLPHVLRYLAKFQGPPTSHRMIEAADEIERLRDRIEELELTLSGYQDGAQYT